MDICILCKSSKKDDVQYGEFLKNKHFGVHTFCLYLTSNLVQNGNDDEGFLGFLERDIKSEVRRVSSLKCCYCRKSYANIGCCHVRCRKTFHFICGIENGAENLFCKDFRSYCNKHTRKVAERPSSLETCLICFENMCGPGERFNKISMILSPCCRSGWFHKLCLQKFAQTAGYFFKCPLCNDKKMFREKLPAKGIFIPNQDAAWELETNAFSELFERPNECLAVLCKNQKGRRAESIKNPFLFCRSCGSVAVHKLCLSKTDKHFYCIDCSTSFEDRNNSDENLNLHANKNDEEIDVCHVSDKEDLEIVNDSIDTSSKMTEREWEPNVKNDIDSGDKNFRRPFESSEEEQLITDAKCDAAKTCTDKHVARTKNRNERASSSKEAENAKNKVLKSQLKNREEQINFLNKERNALKIFNDSQKTFASTKESRLSNGNNVTGSFHISDRFFGLPDDSDEESSEHSECNPDIREKENKRLRRLRQPQKNQDKMKIKSQQTNSESKKRQTKKSSLDDNKNGNFLKLKEQSSTSKKPTNLEIPCISRLTQCKTICSVDDNIKAIQKKKESKNRCCRTFGNQTECKKPKFVDTIFLEHDTSELSESDESSDNEQESNSNDDSDACIKDEIYKKNDIKLKISCTENRRRKRKLLKCCTDSSVSLVLPHKSNNDSKRYKGRTSRNCEKSSTTLSTKPPSPIKLEYQTQRFCDNDKNTPSSKTNIFNFKPSRSYDIHSFNRYLADQV